MLRVSSFVVRSSGPPSKLRLRSHQRSLRTTASIQDEYDPSSSYWERLNSPTSVMAPMVGQSDLPFRRLCRSYGTELCFTQMIHSFNLVKSKSFQDAHLDVYQNDEMIILSPSGINALKGVIFSHTKHIALKNCRIGSISSSGVIDSSLRWSRYQEGDKIEKNPLIVQLAGYDPNQMSKASMIILERTGAIINDLYTGPVSGIDINCGCPQGIARKGRYGAFLMEESVDNVCNIISAMRRVIPRNVGISVKMRIPENVGESVGDAILKERVCKLIDAGVDLLTVHGRTLKENKTKVQECNWDAIAQVVDIARAHSENNNFPVIANGGIEYSSDVQRCLAHTGASAVMSSEALLENPGLFSVEEKCDLDLSPEQIFQRQMRYCHEYLDFCILYPPVPGSLGKAGGSFNCIRGHLFKILYRYLEEQPDLRSKMAELLSMTSIQDARDLLHEIEGRYSASDWNSKTSVDTRDSSWYRRHRDAKTSSRIRTRGQTSESELSGLSIAEKKLVIQRRIKKLKESRPVNKLRAT
eukprot:CAMPEP_0194215286 /NCGR_PEP_ID=MMETSP0156-20130528/16991_1 /TAXON_ID=33649 /ORGANISM="Thalassionema nitzschioides, Strain L26-B" /LENGTH=526 /DNA_ID=CAMNT_0038943767 /DNA_START=200 /DNA_END=1780 /DNA_ORIENTATION=-